MSFIEIENVGKFGIITDLEPHEMPPEAWSGGNNVRFINNYVEKSAGEVPVFGTPAIDPYWLLPWKLLTEYRWLYADASRIYYYNGSVHINATRFTTSSGDNNYAAGGNPTWTGGILHGVPIANNNGRADLPQQWDGALGRFKDLANWPVNTYAGVIRPFKTVLVAMDITQSSGLRYPYIVKWSHPADPGTVPSSWDAADPTKIAGEQTIAQTGGFVVDCLPLGETNIIYKTDAIWGMQPSGTLSVFRFSPISSTVGALAPNCIVEFFKQHFVVGTNDIVLFNGVTPKSIISQRMRKWFFGTIDGTYYDRTVVNVNYSKREVWVCFVESGSTTGQLSKALIWNWEENNWSIVDLDNISFLTSGEVNTTTNNSFDAATGTFDTDIGLFGGSGGVTPAELQVLQSKVGTGKSFLQTDKGYTHSTGNYTSYLERTGLALVGRGRDGTAKVDPASYKFLRSVFPKISAPTNTIVKISAGSQDTADGVITWEGPYDFVVGVDTKVDFSISGTFLGIRFEDSNTVPWKLTGYTLDLDILSRL